MKICEKNYYTRLLLENKDSAKNIWKVYGELINNNKKKKENVIKKLIYEDIEMTDTTEIANAFNNYFSLVGTKLASKFSRKSDFKK